MSRRVSVRLIKPRAITTITSFSHRVVNSWNDLPEDVVLADSMKQFKNKLFFKHRAFKYEMIFKYDEVVNLSIYFITSVT